MTAPTSVSVSVDSAEYSRYETANNTITATVTIQGGAIYVDEPIVVELIKARRARDTVVATAQLDFNGPSDPQEGIVEFYLPDLVDQDLISLIRHGKYFIRAMSEETPGTISTGTDPNGILTYTVDDGVNSNTYTFAMGVFGTTSDVTVLEIGTDLAVLLPSNTGTLIPDSATFKNVSDAINQYFGYSFTQYATFSGSGDTYVTDADFVADTTPLTGGSDEITGDTADFDISIVTVDRFKEEFLFGVDVSATNLLEPKFQPAAITGVTIVEMSDTVKTGFTTLSYSYTESHPANASATLGSGTDGTVTVEGTDDNAGSDGNIYSVEVLSPLGTTPLSVALVGTVLQVSLSVQGGAVQDPDNTATKIADAISAIDGFTGTASGTGFEPITAIEGPTAMTGGLTNIIRTISWNGGASVPISGSGVYILKGGVGANCPASIAENYTSNSYICVRVQSSALLPEESVSEELLIDRKRMDDDVLRKIICESVAWVENDFLNTYLEPTVVTSDRDPTTIQYTAGVQAPTPIYSDPDFDVINGPLTYFTPQSADWIHIQTPYIHLLRVDSLFGSIANTRVIDIDLEWIHHYDIGGMIQLVPFNQEIAFDFVGLIWSNAIRGAVAIPNFWHFNVVAGLRDVPCDLQDLVGRYAAMKALTLAGQAFRPGLGSLSLSRDGVSESLSYNTGSNYGIYTSSIQAHKDWMEENKTAIRAKYRGMLTRFV